MADVYATLILPYTTVAININPYDIF